MHDRRWLFPLLLASAMVAPLGTPRAQVTLNLDAIEQPQGQPAGKPAARPPARPARPPASPPSASQPSASQTTTSQPTASQPASQAPPRAQPAPQRRPTQTAAPQATPTQAPPATPPQQPTGAAAQPGSRPATPAAAGAAAAAAAAIVIPEAPAAAPVIAPPPTPAPTPPPPRPTPVANAGSAAAPLGSGATDGLRVRFPPGRSELSPEADAALQSFAKSAPRNENVTFNVAAYAAGNAEDPSTPRRVALARALAIRTTLMAEGIASTRIYVRAHGVPTDGKDGPADRVDISVLGLGAAQTTPTQTTPTAARP